MSNIKPRQMTPADLQHWIWDHRMQEKHLARALGETEQTVKDWLTGDRELPYQFERRLFDIATRIKNDPLFYSSLASHI